MQSRKNLLAKLSFSVLFMAAALFVGQLPSNMYADSNTINAFICSKTEINLEDITTNDTNHILEVGVKTGGADITILLDGKSIHQETLTSEKTIEVELSNLTVGEHNVRVEATGDCSGESLISKEVNLTVRPATIELPGDMTLPNTGYFRINGLLIDNSSVFVTGVFALIIAAAIVYVYRQSKKSRLD